MTTKYQEELAVTFLKAADAFTQNPGGKTFFDLHHQTMLTGFHLRDLADDRQRQSDTNLAYDMNSMDSGVKSAARTMGKVIPDSEKGKELRGTALHQNNEARANVRMLLSGTIAEIVDGKLARERLPDERAGQRLVNALSAQLQEIAEYN